MSGLFLCVLKTVEISTCVFAVSVRSTTGGYVFTGVCLLTGGVPLVKSLLKPGLGYHLSLILSYVLSKVLSKAQGVLRRQDRAPQTGQWDLPPPPRTVVHPRTGHATGVAPFVVTQEDFLI